jgi:hypothetical protein
MALMDSGANAIVLNMHPHHARPQSRLFLRIEAPIAGHADARTMQQILVSACANRSRMRDLSFLTASPVHDPVRWSCMEPAGSIATVLFDHIAFSCLLLNE